MQRCRTVFRFTFDNDLILHPIKFGTKFEKPERLTIRCQREAHRVEPGGRVFEVAEIRQRLAEAKQPLRSMILLGTDCGFGQTDLVRLPMKAVHPDTGWIDFGRPKTGVHVDFTRFVGMSARCRLAPTAGHDGPTRAELDLTRRRL